MRINPRFLVCTVLLLFAAMANFAQVIIVPNTPTSGALLTIQGTVNGLPVNIAIYDSQIHSGSVFTVPANVPSTVVVCGVRDQAVPTDAYVLQGGSATGCDAGDAFEVTDNNPNAGHQLPGKVDITLSAGIGSPALPGSGFHIETHYVCSGSVSVSGEGGPGECSAGETPVCNTKGDICAGPDTGFLTVTNNTGYTFNGVITLQGNSPTSGGFCPPASSDPIRPGGLVIDSLGTSATPYAFAPSNPDSPSSVTLALSTDSSNCTGFNFDQVSSKMTSPTQVTTFIFGKDKFTVTPSNINNGDILTHRPVPMPASQFNLPGPNLTGSPQGNGSQCVSIADFAAPGNPVCPEFQTHCYKSNADGNPIATQCDDATTFFWTGEFDAHLDPNARYPLVNGVPEVGGVHFLGAPGVPCAKNSFTEDIVSAYTGDSPGDLPLKSGGSGLNCFVTSFDAGAAPIPQGVTVTPFTGFFSPVSDTEMNAVQLGRTVPLKFSLTSGAGGAPVSNLSLCPAQPSGTSCPTPGVNPPWIFLGVSTLSCAAAAADTSGTNFAADDTALTTSGLQNLGGGNYLFTWKIPKSSALLNTCAAVNVTLSNGLVLLDVASFKFGNQ